MIRAKATGVLAATALAAAGFAAVPVTHAAAAAPAFICNGGTYSVPATIPAGVFSSVTVNGICTTAPGTLTAQSLTIASGGAFAQFLSTQTLDVLGNVSIGWGGVFFIGCGTSLLDDATCPDNAGATTDDIIGGNLSSFGAALLVVHFSTVDGSVKVSSGGGGTSCDLLPNVLPPTPPFVDFDYDFVGLSASVSGLSTCWAGFADSLVVGSLGYNGNVTGEPDGNFVGDNLVGGNLTCLANSPKTHLSDVFAFGNEVLGRTFGQCNREV